MGKMFLYGLVFTFLCQLADARIYESVEQQKKRYGSPLEVNVSDFKDFGNKVYHVDPFLIAVNLQTVSSLNPWKKYEIAGPFRVNSIVYSKPIVLQPQKSYYDAYFTKENAGSNNQQLTTDEIDKILTANDPEQVGWTSLDDTDDAETWCRDDMKYYAIYDKKQKTMRVFLDVLWKNWLSKENIHKF